MASRHPSAVNRPRRGTRDSTHTRLIEVGAAVFNEVGYWGTDSNILAKQAGYAPGTFYRHFVDKREIFLAAYAHSVHSEWKKLADRLAASGGTDLQLASQLLRFLVAHHRQWRTLRASARALAATDELAMKFFVNRERERLTMLRGFRKQLGRAPHSIEEDLTALIAVERICDALADGEAASLGAKRDPLLKQALELLQRNFGP